MLLDLLHLKLMQTATVQHLYCAQWSTNESNLRLMQSLGGHRWLNIAGG